jgi:hypothetical protein
MFFRLERLMFRWKGTRALMRAMRNRRGIPDHESRYPSLPVPRGRAGLNVALVSVGRFWNPESGSLPDPQPL